MRLLGNVFIGLGVLLLPTLIFTVWGFGLILAGALLRISARPTAG